MRLAKLLRYFVAIALATGGPAVHASPIYDVGFRSLGLSPDGQRVVYYREPRLAASAYASMIANGVLVIHDQRTGLERMVEQTRFAALSGPLPTWSPDGRRLAYYALNQHDTAELRIWDESRGVVIAHSASAVCTLKFCKEMAPVWSPDGRVVYFLSPADNMPVDQPQDLPLDQEMLGVVPARGGMTVLTSQPLLQNDATSPDAGLTYCDTTKLIKLKVEEDREQVLASGAAFVDFQWLEVVQPGC